MLLKLLRRTKSKTILRGMLLPTWILHVATRKAYFTWRLAQVNHRLGRNDRGRSLQLQAIERTGHDPTLVMELVAGDRAEQWRFQNRPVVEAAVAEHPDDVGLRRSLARLYAELGDTERATAIYRHLVTEPGQPIPIREQLTLPRMQLDSGDGAGALESIDLILGHLNDDDDPGTHYRIARIFERLGLWMEAAQHLGRSLERSPGHAASHFLRGQLLRRMMTFGGSYIRVGDARDSGPQWKALEELRDGEGEYFWPGAASEAAQYHIEAAFALKVQAASRMEELGATRLDNGNLASAVAGLEAGILRVDHSTSSEVFQLIRPRLEFLLELARSSAGRRRVDDPLFDCHIEVIEDGIPPGYDVVGSVTARFTWSGLELDGIVGEGSIDQVEIWIDDRLLRPLHIAKQGVVSRFKYTIKRSTLELLPVGCQLTVRSPAGVLLPFGRRSAGVQLHVPHGEASVGELLDAGVKIDKKGVIPPSPSALEERHRLHLELYSELRGFLRERFDRTLLLSYGTLLGYHREGDFIQGDDDFDAFYISPLSEPRRVKEEAKRILVELVGAGFTVSLYRNGVLMRVGIDGHGPDGFHLDIRPLWFNEGRAWIHKQAAFPARVEDFSPPRTETWRGTEVDVPRLPEVFLRGYYGEDWDKPDPGFKYYASEVDRHVRDELEKALLTPREFRKLEAEIARLKENRSGAGRFVCIGLEPLYPLRAMVA
jgi:hypothetical protein